MARSDRESALTDQPAMITPEIALASSAVFVTELAEPPFLACWRAARCCTSCAASPSADRAPDSCHTEVRS